MCAFRRGRSLQMDKSNRQSLKLIHMKLIHACIQAHTHTHDVLLFEHCLLLNRTTPVGHRQKKRIRNRKEEQNENTVFLFWYMKHL